jgi:hypothetical protein
MSDFEFETETRALRLLAKIHEANKINASNESVPEVGIFWIDTDKKSIIKFSTPWSDVMGDRGLYDVGMTHYTYWSRYRTRHGNYGNLEYEDLPRGRVIYDKTNDLFKVYCGTVIGTNAVFKELILSNFNLPSAKTKFLRDAHYEPTADFGD